MIACKRSNFCVLLFALLTQFALSQARPRITISEAMREINSRVFLGGDVIAEDPHRKEGIGAWDKSSEVSDPFIFIADASASQKSNIELSNEDATLTVNEEGNAFTTIELLRRRYGRGIQAFSSLDLTFNASHWVMIDLEGYLQSLYIHWNGFSFAYFYLSGPEGFTTIFRESGLREDYVPFSARSLLGPPGTYTLSVLAVSYCDYDIEKERLYDWINNYWNFNLTVNCLGMPVGPKS